MLNINDLIAGGTQLTISHEVLTLLRWLMENHAEELTKITRRALQHGLHDKIHAGQAERLPQPEEAYENVAHFFGMIEEILIKALDEHVTYRKHENKLQPIINHIDATYCDSSTVQLSVEKTATKIAQHTECNPRDILFKEILRQWRPRKSSLIN
jgi:hypothetical protein